MFSHVNDAGFWLFKEYFGLSVKDTLFSWSIMEAIVPLLDSLLFTIAINFILAIILNFKIVKDVQRRRTIRKLGLTLPPATGT
jgi:H+/gluconate symporter-like permease